VEDKTKDKIKELIKPRVLTEMTRLVLTNAIYFKGRWLSPFKGEKTRSVPFTLIHGEKVDVPMMNQVKEFHYAENENVQVLEMPYEGDKLSMVVFLPKEEIGIKKIEPLFTVENMENWMSALRERKIIVLLPKFKMTSAFLLNDVLKVLGMTDAFDINLADFTGMTSDPVGLYISHVIHKAFVDVNEEGTEAAAATAVVMRQKSAMSEPMPVFRADHPFIFIIRDKDANNVLFIGRVMDPRG
jgi:serpin B